MPASTNVGFKGVDSLQSGLLVFTESLKDSDGAKVTSGTASLRIYEVQSDGSFKSFDFSTNTFKTTTLTTETASLAHQLGNNGATATGVWTYAQNAVGGFTRGAVYISTVSHTSAFPPSVDRKWVYGDAEGDLTVRQSGQALSDVDTVKTQAVTCAAPVTVSAYVGTSAASTAQTGDCYPRLGAPTGVSLASDVASLSSSVAASFVTVEADVADVYDAVLQDQFLGVESGTAQGGSLTTLVLPEASTYTLPSVGQAVVYLTAGTGKGRGRRVNSVNVVSPTHRELVFDALPVAPANDTEFSVFEFGDYVVTNDDGEVTATNGGGGGGGSDPWLTNLPNGSYAANTAGRIVQDILSGVVSANSTLGIATLEVVTLTVQATGTNTSFVGNTGLSTRDGVYDGSLARIISSDDPTKVGAFGLVARPNGYVGSTRAFTLSTGFSGGVIPAAGDRIALW